MDRPSPVATDAVSRIVDTLKEELEACITVVQLVALSLAEGRRPDPARGN